MMQSQIVENEWLLSEASVRGKGHFDGNLPNQDSVAVRTSPDGDIVVAVVSDGAGTAAKSGIGSRKTADFMSSWLLKIGEDVQQGRLSLGRVRDRLIEGVTQLRAELDPSGSALRDYHCTLVACLIMPNGGIICQIGDSIALASRFDTLDSGHAKQVDFFPDDACQRFDVERGEYSNETHFITEADWHRHLRIAPLPDDFDAVVMMTDGAMDIATLHGKVFRGFLSNLVGRVLKTDARVERQKIIEDWLADRQTYVVTADDKTIFMAIRRRCIKLANFLVLVDASVASTSAAPNAAVIADGASTPVRPDQANSRQVSLTASGPSKEPAAWSSPINLPASASRVRRGVYASFVAVALITAIALGYFLNHVTETGGKNDAAGLSTSGPKVDRHDSKVSSAPNQSQPTSSAHMEKQLPETAEVVFVPPPSDIRYRIIPGGSMNFELSLSKGTYAAIAVQSPDEKSGIRLENSEKPCNPTRVLNAGKVSCSVSVVAKNDAKSGKHTLVIELTGVENRKLEPLRLEIEILKKETTADSITTTKKRRAAKPHASSTQKPIAVAAKKPPEASIEASAPSATSVSQGGGT